MSLRNSPVVSVVMPSYNHERFINYSIESVISQTLRSWELVVVDDGSNDGSREIIEDWLHRDNRINRVFHAENEGIAKTVNDGIRAASGQYVLIMASDDMLKRNALQLAVHTLDSNADCGAAILEAEIIDDRNNSVGILFSDLYRGPTLKKGFFFGDLVKSNYVCTGVVRRALIDEHGIGFDESMKYLNDWLFWLDLSRVCKFIYMSDPLYGYRVHSNNTLRLDLVGHAADWLVLPEKMFEKYGTDLSAENKSILLRTAGEIQAVAGDIRSARELLCRSIGLDQDFKSRARSTLILLFVNAPRLYFLSRKMLALLPGFERNARKHRVRMIWREINRSMG